MLCIKVGERRETWGGGGGGGGCPICEPPAECDREDW